MKTWHVHHWLILGWLFVMGGRLGAADAPPAGERPAPYFQLNQGEATAFPLRSTKVEVKIAGVIADVCVRQVYENRGSRPIEALYVFPGSTGAAVYGMEMRIGERVIKAKVAPRQEARETYENAKREGRRAALLQEQRPNVFEMNVAQILPGDVVSVELRYTELLSPEAGEYAFLFPTVVGPRYVHKDAEPGRDDWVANPYLKPAASAPGADEPVASPSTFELAVTLKTGLPLQDIASPTHGIDIAYSGADEATITLKPSRHSAGDRDFVLRYRLADRKITTGLLLSQGEAENFFTLLIEPPRRVSLASIPARDYLFVIDVSGSMHGFPLSVAKKMMAQLLGSLRERDRFNILTFSGASGLFAQQPLPATRQNIRDGLAYLERHQGGGGTELLPALQKALAFPGGEDQSRSIVVVTDGYVTCEAEAFELIRTGRNQANLYAFGIGSSVNRHLIEGMARAGGGTPFVILGEAEVSSEVAKFKRYVESPVLTKIEFSADGFEVDAVEPSPLPDLLAERPITVMGKWKGEPKGELILKGYTGEGPFEERIPVAQGKWMGEGQALAQLWARTRVTHFSDRLVYEKDKEVKERILELGMAYNLLTSETSFVAVDEAPVNPGGEVDTLKQPLPLPEGVSEFAIGGGGGGHASIPSTPEPETWALLGVLAVIITVQLWRRRRGKCAAH